MHSKANLRQALLEYLALKDLDPAFSTADYYELFFKEDNQLALSLKQLEKYFEDIMRRRAMDDARPLIEILRLERRRVRRLQERSKAEVKSQFQEQLAAVEADSD